MELSTFIEQKEEAFDEEFDFLDPYEVDDDEIKSFLTQSIKESYALGIERAIEVAEGVKQTGQQYAGLNDYERGYNKALPDLITSLRKEIAQTSL